MHRAGIPAGTGAARARRAGGEPADRRDADRQRDFGIRVRGSDRGLLQGGDLQWLTRLARLGAVPVVAACADGAEVDLANAAGPLAEALEARLVLLAGREPGDGPISVEKARPLDQDAALFDALVASGATFGISTVSGLSMAAVPVGISD